ncbi:MAG: glycosyltransferase family 2 protein, partial [Candidatus Parabeggiatoa sp.]|nr:glycosyltransferase family 2 protein [Candidatus Parabeggiatoa sp.]
ISVIVTIPLNETGLEWYLQAALNSVVQQIYPHWELCLITDTHNTLLESYCRRYPEQIKLAYSQPEQSLASQINTALALATGDYTVFLWADDVLSEDALLEVAKRINQAAEPIDMLYSDEDQMNDLECFHKPYFKPAWAPEMLKGQMYTGQLGVYRTCLLKEIGGMREVMDSQALGEWAAKLLKEQINQGQWLNFIKKINLFYKAQHELHLWDLVLKFTEKTQRIESIPKILYHRRRHSPVSITQTHHLKIVQQALDREGLGGRVTPNPLVAHSHILHYPVQRQPLVSIIIPTKDMAAMLAQCIESIRTLTTYPNWEIIIVDNGSTDAITLALFEKYKAKLGQAFTVSRHDIPFNFSKLVNHGVKAAKGDIILLLNNDTTVLGPPDWLQDMIGFAQHPEIAAVGCKLLYPEDNTIQHAGLICGLGGIANHGHKHFPANSTGYFNRLAIVANYSAITGACLMIKRTLWEQVNGFDEHLAIAFNDVDFCLKLLHKGLRHVVLPHVTFYHHESKSRGLEDTSAKKKRLRQEEAYMKQRWGTILQNDPFYNPHLTKQAEDFRLASDSIYYCQSAKKWWKLW